MQKKRLKHLVLVAALLAIYSFATAKAVFEFDNFRVVKAREYISSSSNLEGQEKLLQLQKAALLNPNEETYLKAGIMADDLGLEEVAQRYLKRVKTAEGYFELGTSYLAKYEYKKAEAAFTNSLSKEKAGKAYLGLAKSKLGQNELESAKVEIGRAEEVSNDEEVVFYRYLITKLQGNEAVAPSLHRDYAEMTRKIDQFGAPGNLQNVLYSTLNALNYPQVANSYLEEQGVSSNLNREGYLLLAKHYYEEMEYQKQYDALLRAKHEDPTYPQTYQQLVEAAKRLNKQDEAIAFEAYYKKLTW